MPQLLYPYERTPVPTECKAGWAPEPVCMIWRREKYFTPAGFQTPKHPACSLETIMVALSQLPYVLEDD
jgi:hypothetical protein